MSFMHNIFIANSFREGKRIAYDLVISKNGSKNVNLADETVRNFVLNLYDVIGDNVAITTHSIVTNSPKWISVVNKDSFFKDIKLIKNSDEFIELVKYNNILKKSDVLALIKLYRYTKNINYGDIENDLKYVDENYFDLNGEHIYQNCIYDDNSDINLNIKEYADIICDRILSSKDGFLKYKFVIKKLDDLYFTKKDTD